MTKYSIKIKEVSTFPKARFEVEVLDNTGKTEHVVFVEEQYYTQLTNKDLTPEELVEKSFQFLLERESKESILREFNLKEIERYFPEYKDKIKTY